MLSPLKFGLRATKDHHDHVYIPVIIMHLSIVAKTFYWDDNKMTEFIAKTSSTTYVILYELIDFWARTGGWEFDYSLGAGTSSPTY